MTQMGMKRAFPAEADYFAVFGLPQKLQIDADALEEKFHQLNWKLHPDNFASAPESERALSAEQSSQVNDAYRTLRDPIRRVEYLLLCAGVRKEGSSKQQAPPELLEEVFELNESLDELREVRAGSNGGELATLKAKLEVAERHFEEKLESVDAELNGAFVAWDVALDAGADEMMRAALMQRMNEALNRRSYVRNLVANVRTELSGEL